MTPLPGSTKKNRRPALAVSANFSRPGTYPLALAVGKEILNRDSWDGYQYAVEAISLLQSADDFKEGIAAFTDRREPVFR